MKDVGLEAYRMHDYAPDYNEIMWEFYTHMEPPKKNFPAHS